MRNMIDMAPFARSTIGFDWLFDQLENLTEADMQDSYPSYNIERTSEDQYRVVLAVAGFSENELIVNVESNQLFIAGRKPEPRDENMLYRGIAQHSFKLRFNLADFVVVKSASLSGGLLTIELERQIPEAMKPRRISITEEVPSKPTLAA